MQIMVIIFFIIGMIFVVIGLHQLNIDLIYKFLTKKEMENFKEDDLIDLNMRNLSYDKNYEYAKVIAWYLTSIEIALALIIIVCFIIKQLK